VNKNAPEVKYAAARVVGLPPRVKGQFAVLRKGKNMNLLAKRPSFTVYTQFSPSTSDISATLDRRQNYPPNRFNGMTSYP